MKTFAIAALALGMGMVPVLAQKAPSPRKDAKPASLAEVMEKALNLTDAQKASIQGIRAKHKEALEKKGLAAQNAARAYMEAFQKPETSVETLRKLHHAAGDTDFDLMLEHRGLRQELRAVLTPEQRERAAKLEDPKTSPILRRKPAVAR